MLIRCLRAAEDIGPYNDTRMDICISIKIGRHQRKKRASPPYGVAILYCRAGCPHPAVVVLVVRPENIVSRETICRHKLMAFKRVTILYML